MAFLVVAGFTIPVANGSAKRPKAEEIGALERMADGSLMAHRRAKKRRLEFEIPVSAEAMVLEAYEGLLRGDGHVFGFGSGFGLYSYKGLGPSSSSGATQATGGKYDGKLTLAATSGTITYDADLPSNRWTVMFWRHQSSTWTHYVVRGDGAKWADGVRSDATSTSFLTVPGDGTATLENTGGSSVDYSDLVLLPYYCHDDWPALVAASTRAFSPLPKLEVYGDALLGSAASAPVTMLGEVGDATYVPANTGSGRDVTAQRLSATLREV